MKPKDYSLHIIVFIVAMALLSSMTCCTTDRYCSKGSCGAGNVPIPKPLFKN